MQKRKSPSELVNTATVASGNWFDLLSKEDQRYIYEVAKCVCAQPQAKHHTVAGLIISELKLKQHSNTVTRLLKKLIRNENLRKKNDKA
jgi:hypothetical protein